MGSHRKAPTRRQPRPGSGRGQRRAERQAYPAYLLPAGVVGLVLIMFAVVVVSLRGGDESNRITAVRPAAGERVVPPAVAAGATPGVVSLGSELSGKRVVGNGDENGQGRAMLKLRGSKLCFTLTWERIDPPTAAEISAGVFGEAGPVKIALFDGKLPANFRGVTGCVELKDKEFARALGTKPAEYHLTLRPGPGPEKAIRGQLLTLPEPIDLFQAMGGPLVALADGAQETGGPGDTDGRATAAMKVNNDEARFVATWTGIVPPTFGHIHKGRVGQGTGPIVVPLFAVDQGLPPTLTGVAGFVEQIKPATIRGLNTNPSDYFLRLHNSPHPGGALRGQFALRGNAFATTGS